MRNWLARLVNCLRDRFTTGPSIEFESREKIEPLQDLADQFLERIFGASGAFITDESSLWDFEPNEDLSAIHKKIQKEYGINVRDVANGTLVEILTRIERG